METTITCTLKSSFMCFGFLAPKDYSLFCFSIFNVERTGEGYSRYAPCALDIYVFIVSM